MQLYEFRNGFIQHCFVSCFHNFYGFDYTIKFQTYYYLNINKSHTIANVENFRVALKPKLCLEFGLFYTLNYIFKYFRDSNK